MLQITFGGTRLSAADKSQLNRIEQMLVRLLTQGTQMTQAITDFQTQMSGFATTLGADFDAIATEEQALKDQIATLQATVAAGGTLSADDQAALASIEAQYAALVQKAAALVPAPPAAG